MCYHQTVCHNSILNYIALLLYSIFLILYTFFRTFIFNTAKSTAQSNIFQTSSELFYDACYNISMSKILIIGNVLKDVYIKLDDRHNDFETDANDIDWLNLGFNGAAHSFFRRTSVYGGAAVSLSVLNRLGLSAEILNSRTEIIDGEVNWLGEPDNYRYILCHRDEITYFVPSSRKVTDWSMPTDNPEWILVDRSTNVSTKLVDEIKNFLKFSPTTKLAVHAEKHATPAGEKLARMADILFIEDEPAMHPDVEIVDHIDPPQPHKQLVCHISPRKIVFGDAEESWSLNKTDMMTHLTVYSTIVATILGVISVGGSPTDAVLWARINAEQATIAGSLSTKKLQEFAKKEKEKRANLPLVAKLIMAPKKGVLAMDESEPKLTERLVKAGIAGTESKRKAYREMLLTTPDLEKYLSAVILSETSAKQRIKQRQSIAAYLTGRGIITGLKVDQGLAEIPETGETYTTGIESLPERLRTAYNNGFRFAKWRAAFQIQKDQPSFIAVERNAELLASFAKECQLAGVVPIVESDITMDGNYSVEECAATTDRILNTIFIKLEQRRIDLSGCLLKTNMVISGSTAETPANADAIGMATAAILRHAVPKYLGGVLLLSGGQPAKVATQNFTAICQNAPYPWPISFAFGRALQEPSMITWKGQPDNIVAAQAALKRHLEANIDALRYLR